MRVEQSYKQVKQTLGWTEYQVRADRAIRRHWQLVVCAFSFCWWAEAALAGPVWGLSAAAAHPTHEVSGQEEPVVVPLAAPGKKKPRRPRSLRRAPKLAPRFAPCPGVAGARDHAVALLARVVGQGPTARLATTPGLAVGGTRDRSLYPVTTNYCYTSHGQRLSFFERLKVEC